MLHMELMSVQLALDLDHDAIRLLSRQSDGWVVEGVAALNADNITERIAMLRQRAQDLVGPDPAVMLVLPRSQVLYTRFDGLALSDVGAQLEHLTPYDLADITWDTVETDAEIQVAAVAYETLDEAIAFANASKFRITGLTSEPPEGLFPRLPVFAQRKEAAPAPIVLEPAAPPPRQDVAFSSQRSRTYAPRGVRPPGRLHLRPSDTPKRSNPSALLAALSAVPTRARAAIGAAALIGLGVLLWPDRDPDPFTQRDFEADFASIPAAETTGPETPRTDTVPEFAPFDAATLLRDPPPIAVPVIIGTSGITLDAVAGAAPEQVFAALAAKPFVQDSRIALAATADPRRLPIVPELAVPEGVLNGDFIRAVPPAILTADPNRDTRPDLPDLLEASSIRAPELSLLAEVALPATPRLAIDPIDRPTRIEPLLAALPAAPKTTPNDERIARLPDRTDSVLAPRLPGGVLTETVPNAAMALPPAASGQSFALADDGFVAATPEGTPSPDGILVFAGRPTLVAPPRPTAPPPEVNVGDPAIAAVLPRPRPVVTRAATPSVAIASTVVLGDDGATARGLLAPPEVPEDLIAEALAAEPEPEETVTAPQGTLLTASLVPRPRPTRPTATTAPTQASATRAAVPAPRIPSSANVAREATIENGIRFQRINLIGVYGAASDRRALVRLPSGKFIKLQVGDRLDGGRVAQIGPDTLVYQKGGRNLALSMPNT